MQQRYHSSALPLFGGIKIGFNPVKLSRSLKNHRIKPQYLGILVPRFEVDLMKTQGEITLRNLDTEE